MRYVFNCLDVPFAFSTAVLFLFHTSVVLSLRRFWFDQPALRDVVGTAATTSCLELVLTLGSAVAALLSHRAYLKRGQPEMADAQMSLFVASVATELVAEHVALHSLVAYNFFLDPRIMSISMQLDRGLVIKAWAVSFALELATDVLIMVPMLGFLPVGRTRMWNHGDCSWPVMLFLLCACVHHNLIGLHSYLDEDRYFCN
mmetsp:Transcript_90653/g.282295  ORF Transcript_90653/g.282295 Transcript_90653/m.282295 type:complete len:201 (+) Transcript_90653:690-1292(+)